MPGHRMGDPTNADFAAPAGETKGQAIASGHQKGHLPGPELVHEVSDAVIDPQGHLIQHGKTIDEHQQGFVRIAFFDVKNPGHSPYIQSIGPQSVKARGGEHHHLALMDSVDDLDHDIGIGLLRI